MEERISASFRDPSGMVFTRGGIVFRQVNQAYQEDYDLLHSSGLYQKLVSKHLIIPHREVDQAALEPALCYRVIQPEQIAFISYPYEWSFSQLKDAALATLEIQKQALARGMVLKDASAYNIQFHLGSPTLIDTLSFARYVEGAPWVAYRQFCQHFLAPLALMSLVDVRLGKLLSDFIDGIPLDLCSRLLPATSRLNLGLLMHIHLHAEAEGRYAETRQGAKPAKPMQVSKAGLVGLMDNLAATIKKLNLKIRGREWAGYYGDTNYTSEAFEAKAAQVEVMLKSLSPHWVLDLGANTGIFSQLAARLPGCFVVSSDIDYEAVEQNYLQVKNAGLNDILPLVLDLNNPTPAIGWDNNERSSFIERSKFDVVMALALVHHLAIANNVPLDYLARSMAAFGEHLILEFVPKEDSQVGRLLRSREDIFPQYTLEGLVRAFEPYFIIQRTAPIPSSQRTLLLMQRK